MTDDQIDGLVPIGPHDHPDNHILIWSCLELRAIRAHTRAAVRAALEVQRQEVERERNARRQAQEQLERLQAEVVRLEAMRQRADEIERLRAELKQLTAYADSLNERCIADSADIGRLRECLEWLQERHQGGLMRAKIDEALGADKAAEVKP